MIDIFDPSCGHIIVTIIRDFVLIHVEFFDLNRTDVYFHVGYAIKISISVQ